MSLDYTVYLGPYAEVRQSKGTPSWGDFALRINGALACHLWTGRHAWYPNERRDPPHQRKSFDPREVQVLEAISAADLVAESEWFQRAFRAELDALRQAYGVENVEVRWGLLSMIS